MQQQEGGSYLQPEPGKSGRLLAVSIPVDTEDVEECLVGGVEPNQIRWIGDR